MSDTEENPRKRQRLDTANTTATNTGEDTNMTEPSEPTATKAQPPAPQEPAMSQSQQEQAVGITAYASPDAPGFGCVVKQRYTDFLVNEILPSGEVLHLVDTGDTRKFQGKDVKAKDGDVRAASKAEFKNEGAQAGAAMPAEASAGAVVDGKGEAEAAIPQLGGAGDSKPVKEAEVPVVQQATAAPTEAESSEPSATASNGQIDASIADSGVAEDTAASAAAPPAGMHPSRAQAIKQGDSDAKKARLEALKSITNEDRDVLIGIFGEITTEEIIGLYGTIMGNPGKKPRDYPSVKSEVISDKAKRTEAHVACRRIFNSKLETAMVQDSPGTLNIKAAPAKGNDYHRSSRVNTPKDGPVKKGKLGWQDLGGEYLHFTLYKENKDTMEILYFIGSQLKVPAKNFQFAGTKDRRGVTVQRVCIFRVHADRIARLNRGSRGWKCGGFEYKQHGLDLGELTGNEFTITLRNCCFHGEDDMSHDQRLDLAKSAVSKAATSFQSTGFLNYYGLQRFGSFTIGTHTTGLKMLQGKLEAAVDSILTYSDEFLPENQDPTNENKVPGDDISRADAIRDFRSSGKAGYALDHLPKRFQAESALIKYLGHKDRNTGNRTQASDFQGALMCINRPLRLMYVHAYQSLVFNTVAAKRWDLFGDKVVEGDLVVVGTKEDKSAEDKAPTEEVDESGEPIVRPSEEDVAGEDKFTRARALSKEEAESGRFDIFDIVLPLPGWDVTYPANELGKFYEEFMASDAGGGLDPHNMRRAWKDVSLSGDYRKMMAKPGKGFSCEVKEYVDDSEQMVETDLEKLQRPWQQWKNFQTTEKAEFAAEDAAAEAIKNGEVAVQEPGKTEESKVNSKDKKIGVVVKMQLGSSQYATMALRELCKGGAGAYKPEWSGKRN
ncbi:hypothetical protein MBLNU230_g7525t1 [Neophaeotheca triangularis]